MTRKSKEEEKEYQRKYYEEHIKNNEEARERKNARQREYAKRKGGMQKMQNIIKKLINHIQLICVFKMMQDTLNC